MNFTQLVATFGYWAVLVLCLFVTCIFILLRNIRRLEDLAERMLPGPLDPDVGKKNQDAKQDH